MQSVSMMNVVKCTRAKRRELQVPLEVNSYYTKCMWPGCNMAYYSDGEMKKHYLKKHSLNLKSLDPPKSFEDIRAIIQRANKKVRNQYQADLEEILDDKEIEDDLMSGENGGLDEENEGYFAKDQIPKKENVLETESSVNDDDNSIMGTGKNHNAKERHEKFEQMDIMQGTKELSVQDDREDQDSVENSETEDMKNPPLESIQKPDDNGNYDQASGTKVFKETEATGFEINLESEDDGLKASQQTVSDEETTFENAQLPEDVPVIGIQDKEDHNNAEVTDVEENDAKNSEQPPKKDDEEQIQQSIGGAKTSHAIADIAKSESSATEASSELDDANNQAEEDHNHKEAMESNEESIEMTMDVMRPSAKESKPGFGQKLKKSVTNLDKLEDIKSVEEFLTLLDDDGNNYLKPRDSQEIETENLSYIYDSKKDEIRTNDRPAMKNSLVFNIDDRNLGETSKGLKNTVPLRRIRGEKRTRHSGIDVDWPIKYPKCLLCEKEYYDTKQLEKHYEKKHNLSFYGAPLPQHKLALESFMTQQIPKPRKFENYKCTRCRLEFKSSEEYAIHMSQHHVPSKFMAYECPNCMEKFTMGYVFRRHCDTCC